MPWNPRIPAANLAPLPAELEEAISRAGSRLGLLGSRWRYSSCLGSTNDVARALAAEPEAEGAVVIADEQTAGRGRLGRSWHSPPGSGLYVSVVLNPGRARREAARATGLVTLAAGAALAEAIEASTGLRVDVKWPNDLYVQRRKLAGILAEAVPVPGGVSGAASRPAASGWASTENLRETRVVLGYGINVTATAFPPDLGDRATSIESELGRHVDRIHLLVETIAALARRYDDLIEGRFGAILEAWRARAPASRGASVSWTSVEGALSGTTAGVDDHGALLVRVGHRVERIVGGEVTWNICSSPSISATPTS